jgi:hypothetical protein
MEHMENTLMQFPNLGICLTFSERAVAATVVAAAAASIVAVPAAAAIVGVAGTAAGIEAAIVGVAGTAASPAVGRIFATMAMAVPMTIYAGYQAWTGEKPVKAANPEASRAGRHFAKEQKLITSRTVLYTKILTKLLDLLEINTGYAHDLKELQISEFKSLFATLTCLVSTSLSS